MVVDDIAESMKGVADEVVESVLENIVMEMTRDMACEVCFEEDMMLPMFGSSNAKGRLDVYFFIDVTCVVVFVVNLACCCEPLRGFQSL